MSTHDEYMTRRQARDLARRLARLERKTRSTAAAHADLRHSALDQGARIPIKDEQGNTTAYVGSGPTGIEHVDGPVPEQPSAPFVDVGPRVIKVQSSGLDVNENPAPDDLKHVEVHVAQDEVFEPSWSTFATNMDTANGSVTHSLPAGEWYVGLVWVTLSGKRSPMSELVLAVIEPPVDVQDIQDTLDAAEAMLDEYAADVAAPRFDALEEGFEAHEVNIADARDRIEAAEQTLSPLPGRIESTEQDVEAAKEAAESAEARAVEASNNASNRLQNGGFELGLDHWNITNVSLSDDAHTGNQAALIGSGGSLSPDASIPVSEGDVWDVSAFGKGGTALVIEVLNDADDAVLESFSTPMGSTWAETGRQRLEIPAGVEYMNIRITGDSVLVDDVVLRDVTDVVRLERAATAARQTADQALAELELMRLAVDGEGGLKDRLSTAESVLEDKADTSALALLDEKLRGAIEAVESYFSKVWPRSETPPPSGVSYEWSGARGSSRTARRSNGVIVAWNQYPNPGFLDTNGDGFPDGLVQYGTGGNTGTIEVTGDGATVSSNLTGVGRFGLRANQLSKSSSDVFRVEFTADLHPGHRVVIYADQSLDGSFYKSESEYITTSGHHVVELPMTSEADGISIAGTWLDRTSGSVSGESSVTFHRAYVGPRWLNSFDGDTPSDRANDLWYNTDGVPHEWVNGTGWSPISDERIEYLSQAVDSHADRLESAETTLANKADTSALSDLDGVLRQAFGDADEAVTQAAALDAQQKATAAREAAETEAGRLANAEAQAAQTEAIRQSAADALAKAEAARDEAISTSSDDASTKAQAAREAAEAYAAAEAAAKADAAQAEAIRQAALDATEKADQAKTDAEAAAKQYADQQDATVKAEAAADAQTKADDAKEAAEAAANTHADLVAQGAEDAAIAEAARLHNIAVAQAEAAQQRAEEAHSEAGTAWTHADAAMNRAETAETNAIAQARAELAALEVGARNLIKDSAPNITTSEYLVATLDLGGTPPAEGDTVTLSIKGQLGEGRTQWMVYNSGGSVRIQDLTVSTQDDDGVYRVTGAWRVGGSANDHIRVYAFPSSASSESTIEWIKLERGSKATDWQPAPEDIQARIDQAKEDAQAHADNMPKSLGGLTPPTGTAPDGSVWRQRDDTNTIIARWERINGAWVPQQVSGEIIDNLEAGKITALYTEFAEAVINKVWAQLGVFDRLDAREGWVGGVHLENGAVTADKMTITGDMAAAIISADTARIAELIATDVWAELGVFDRLKAVTGWVGGVNLEDGAITAEKITASRELITKIMGAEWAYISEQLVVEGELIANHADIISAAIKNLSVTERADLFEAFITTLGAQEAVIDLLIGTEAWIGGTMLKDDTVTTRHLEVTETMVGKFAELLHLVVDRIDANALWADQTWQAAGHFGSEDADQKTEVDGTGVTLYRLIDGELIPAAQFGGGLTQLAFFDGNDSVGSIDQYGNAAFQELAANHLTVAGREVFPPNPAPHYEGYLWDALPRGIVDKAVADMAGVSEPREAYGFLEVSTTVEAGREYRITHTPFLMNTGEAYHGQFTYTFSDTDIPPSAPHTESERLGARWRIANTGDGPQASGEHVFTPDQTGIIRILLNVRRGSGTGIHFHNSTLYASNIILTLEDIGPARQYSGMRRYAAHGGTGPATRDNQPLARGLTTSWQASWMQTYSGLAGNAQQISRPGLNAAIQGRNLNTGLYFATMLGGYQTTPGTGDDAGQTMQTALNGAELLAGRYSFEGVSQPYRQFGNTHFYWHAHGQPPSVLHMVNPPPNPMHDNVVGSHAGMTRAFPIPDDMLAAIQTGTFQGITIHPTRSDGVRSTDPYHGIRGLGDRGLRIELTYQR